MKSICATPNGATGPKLRKLMEYIYILLAKKAYMILVHFCKTSAVIHSLSVN